MNLLFLIVFALLNMFVGAVLFIVFIVIRQKRMEKKVQEQFIAAAEMVRHLLDDLEDEDSEHHITIE